MDMGGVSSMSKVFLQVPSSGAITEARAKAIAKKRWRIYRNGHWTGDGECDGIEWQGSHGVRRYMTWEQLNAVKRGEKWK